MIIYIRKKTSLKHFPKETRGVPRSKIEELKVFFKEIKKHNINDIISIDETSIKPGMRLSFSRCGLGKRCYIQTDTNEIFKKYSLLVAISTKGTIGYELYNKGSVNAERFNKFTKEICKKYKNKNKLIIMDNARIHKTKEFQDMITKSGNKFLYILPYSPELNPIEEYFNQLKHYMKLDKPMNFEELKISLNNSLKNIKKEHYKNYFIHAYDIKQLKKKRSTSKHRKPKVYKP